MLLITNTTDRALLDTQRLYAVAPLEPRRAMPMHEARKLLAMELDHLRDAVATTRDPGLGLRLKLSVALCRKRSEDATAVLDRLTAAEALATLPPHHAPSRAMYAQAAQACMHASQCLAQLGRQVETDAPDMAPDAMPSAMAAIAGALLLLAVIAGSVLAATELDGTPQALAATGTAGAGIALAALGGRAIRQASARGGPAGGTGRAAWLGTLASNAFHVFDQLKSEASTAFSKELGAQLARCDETTVRAWLGCIAAAPPGHARHAVAMLEGAILAREDPDQHHALLLQAISACDLAPQERLRLRALVTQRSLERFPAPDGISSALPGPGSVQAEAPRASASGASTDLTGILGDMEALCREIGAPSARASGSPRQSGATVQSELDALEAKLAELEAAVQQYATGPDAEVAGSGQHRGRSLLRDSRVY